MNVVYFKLFLLFFVLFIVIMEYNKSQSFSFFTFILMMFLGYFLCDLYMWHWEFFSLDLWSKFFLLLVFFSYSLLLWIFEHKQYEVMFLNFMVLLGSLMVMSCDNLMMLYLGLELQTFSIFMLISKNSYSIKSSESGLKYFILGAISSGILLLGVSFIFLSGLSLNLKELLLINNFEVYSIKMGMSLVIVSMIFKLAMFPFHFWMADMYEGSSWETISLISMIPKMTFVYMLFQLNLFSDFLITCSIFSMIIGTMGALNQTKLKSFLAYSGMSNVGFVTLGLSLINKGGDESSMMYLIVYMLSIMMVFFLVNSKNFSQNYFLMELSSLNKMNKIKAFTWLMILLSLAGIPPFSGFLSKWFILINIMNLDYYFLSFIVVLFSVMGAGYYLSVLKIVYFQESSSYFLWKGILNSENKTCQSGDYILGFLLYFTLFLMIHPNFMTMISFMVFNYHL